MTKILKQYWYMRRKQAIKWKIQYVTICAQQQEQDSIFASVHVKLERDTVASCFVYVQVFCKGRKDRQMQDQVENKLLLSQILILNHVTLLAFQKTKYWFENTKKKEKDLSKSYHGVCLGMVKRSLRTIIQENF